MIGDALHQEPKAFFTSPQRAGLAFGALRRGPIIDGSGNPNAQDQDGGAGEQKCQRRPTHEMSSVSRHGVRRLERGTFHSCVMHAGDRETHDKSCEKSLRRVRLAKGKPERHDRSAHRDHDREHDPPRIVRDGCRHSHRAHARIVHAGYAKPHRQAGHQERLRASSDHGKGRGRDNNGDDKR
ncbi:hypothetical protein ACVWXQ_009227 [Bradyrhizobium sp. S3.14.4]